MAVTKIKPIRGTVNKALAYILDPKKTDDKLYVSSYGCAASDAAAKEFEWTRNLAVQQGMQMPKVIARHLTQSFDVGEVTPKQAHEIGKQFADEWLKGKYEYVIATHIDKGHCHNHIIFNAVNYVDFHAYRSNKQTYPQMRQLSDEIRKEHGLSVIPPSQSKGMSYKEYTEAKRGTSWKQKLKQTIDRCVITARDYDEFLKMLQDAGYRKALKQKAEEARKRKAAREIRRKRDLLQKQREGTAAAVSEMALQKRYRLVVLDLETTGLDATKEEILQVAIIDEDGNELMDERCCPVLNKYWPEAQAIHGISPTDVAGKRAFGEIAPKVAEILLSSELVLAFNESFEYSFLAENGLQLDRLYWADDPMDIFAYKYNEGRWVSLEHAAHHFGYHFDTHDALEDARATLHVYQRLNEECKE